MRGKQSQAKIGVFVCHCGSNIAGYLDCKAVAESALNLPGVVFSTTNLYTCSESGIGEIKKAIQEKNLNRVVVASCSPRTHEPLFRSACKEAGLNPYLFEMVNIRDQCSWVHMQHHENATEKAKELVRMGVAKATHLEPQEDLQMAIEAKVAVIGAGVAGLSAAEALADMGASVTLIEKSPQLGGYVLKLNSLAPSFHDPRDIMKPLIDRVMSHENITVYTGTRITGIEGYVGNYTLDLYSEQEGSLTECVSSIVVAVGAKPFSPGGLFNYNGVNIINQAELEEKLLNEGINPSTKNIVMIQCVGARSERKGHKPYCSRICCLTAVKNATILKQRLPDCNVWVLYRDMQTYGSEFEAMLWRARGAGVKFCVFDGEHPPEIINHSVRFVSPVFDTMELPWDLLVLSTPLEASEEASEIAKHLRLPLDSNNFFLEAHVKLRPLDFATDGVFLCGSCRFPCTAEEARLQGLGAASRVATLLAKGTIVSSALVAEVDEAACCGCKGCLRICPYGAIFFKEEDRVCQVNPILCKGCGACGAACPSHSIKLKGYKPDQMLAQVRALMKTMKSSTNTLMMGG